MTNIEVWTHNVRPDFADYNNGDNVTVPLPSGAYVDNSLTLVPPPQITPP